MSINETLAKTFMEIADSIERGSFKSRIKVGLTLLGSEHGVENLLEGAHIAASRFPEMDIVLIGPKVETKLEQVVVESEDEMYKVMEEKLDLGEIKACVTMHYNFPIGVSTVGRVITPGRGKDMLIGTTTGTSATSRVEAMAKNAIYGIITAKSLGIEKPTVGILNVEGARSVERILKEMKEKGYEIEFSESQRSDGGCVMRGNDLLQGVPDVMVTDSLTGNILMKMFSAANTGGDYEATGYGYGPGLGENYNRNILILSRASGAPVVANAIRYAYEIAAGEINEKAKEEFKKINKVGFNEIIKKVCKTGNEEKVEDVEAPKKEVVTGMISGVEIMELENAVRVLWKAGVYAESGMGCTGPIILVNDEKLTEAIGILAKAGFTSEKGETC